MAKFRKIVQQLEHGEGDAKAVLDLLVRRFSADTIGDNIEKLLNATIPMKHGERPDAAAIAAGVRLILAYRVGEPIKRIAHADMTPRETDDETQARLARSPAAQRALAATLADTPEGRAAMESVLREGRRAPGDIVEADPGEEG